MIDILSSHKLVQASGKKGFTIGGGGGNRTRVQRRNFRHSPGAATVLSSQPLRISWHVATLGPSHKKLSIAWS